MLHPVIIVEYDSRWPALFEVEKNHILEVAGEKILAVEHIGSTAVPGLAAKPIVDMMAGVQGCSDADECLPLLARIGYNHVMPEPDDQEWFYCLGKGPHSVGYHLHLVKFRSNHWNKHLIFRDYLRKHPDVAMQYREFKERMAQKYESDREAYTESKTPFIESLIARIHEENDSLLDRD